MTHYYALSVRLLILATKYITLTKYKIHPICSPENIPDPLNLSLIFCIFWNFYVANIQFMKL